MSTDTTFQWTDEELLKWPIYLADKKFEWGKRFPGALPPPDILFLKDYIKRKQPFQKSWNDQQECLSKREMGQKPWQILTFGDKYSTVKWHLNVQGGYGSMNWSLQQMLSDRNKSVASGHLFIESVRRNADGEVVSIADNIIHNGKRDVVTGFLISAERNIMVVQGELEDYWFFNVKKVSTCIFTTADGIDIHLNDFFWYVTKDFNIFRDFCNSHTGGKVVAHSRVGDIYFSTEQAAIKYVKENRPPTKLFTTTDGVDIFPGMPYWAVDPDFEPFYASGADSGKEPGRKYFSTEAAAIAYAHENKPIYSIKDFREIIKAFEERIAPKTDSHV